MKKVLAGILGISIIAIFSLTFLAAEKPPPGYSWKAVILESSTNLAGGLGSVPSQDPLPPGWVYNDGDEFANVNVFIRTYIKKPNIRYYTPVFSLEVYAPTQVEFKNILLTTSGEDSQLNRCGFPNMQTQAWEMPFCLEAFLNQPHPAPGYKRILLLHEGLCCATQEEADFTLMGIGGRKVMRLHGYIEGQNIYGDCDECDPTDHHCVYLKACGYGTDPY